MRKPPPGYYTAPHWRSLRIRALRRAVWACQVCNAGKDETILDVHHRTYERLWHERVTDLTVLCRDCHSLYHEAARRKERMEPYLVELMDELGYTWLEERIPYNPVPGSEAERVYEAGL